MSIYILAVNKITKRWFLNNFVVILVVLIIIEVLVALGIRSFYYSSVEKFIKSQGLTVLNLLEKNQESDYSDFEFELRSMVENFEQKDKMEMMFLKENGEIFLTTDVLYDLKSEPSEYILDYKKNNKSEDSSYIESENYVRSVYLLNNENVMSVLYPLKKQINDVAYVRFVSSVTNVDIQIIIVIAITALIGICIIFFVVLSSSYFIQSIIVPVGEIGKTARRISQGDFRIRLEKKTDDEIGDLCDTINHMAEELSVAEKLKNEFISSVSHELRTPLTAIKGWAETIRGSDFSDKELIQKAMKVISSETERLSSMVEELLDFSRVQSKNMKLVLTKLDLVAELEDIVIIFQERAKKENIKIVSELPLDDCVLINGDANRLKQVFTNVIDNALKYSEPEQEVLITLEKKINLEKNLNFVLIKIIDNGCGINPKDLPKIKNKFYKANYSKRGSGIGLAVADEIVKLHNGSLDIYSEENKGTTIVIQLPIINN